MTSTASLLPLAAVGLPVLTAVAIVATRRWPAVRDASLVAGAVATFGVVVALLLRVVDGEVPTTTLGSVFPGTEATLTADPMGMLFAALASLLWVLAGSYAIGYMRGDAASNQTRFYAFYALCLSTAFGVAFAGDLFTFFVFYELLTVSTYPLVTHKGDAKAIAAGRTYLGYLLPGGVAVLLATILVYANTGTLTFEAGGIVAGLSTGLTVTIFALFSVGFATKAGVMPLHAWLPAAMVAPTPVSALLHAVAVVKAGVFAFGRVIGFVVGPGVLAGVGASQVLSVFAGATVVVASVVALRQDHLKRRLAFSTIAHLSLIVLGFSLLSPGAFEGSLLHIVNHGVLKITLFFCAGAIHIAAHKDHVSELDGIGRRMPFTMTAFAVAAYGLAALPPMGGFVSKWVLTGGAMDADQMIYAAIVVFSGLFTAGYLFPVVYRAFFRPPRVAQVPAPAAIGAGAPAPDEAAAGDAALAHRREDAAPHPDPDAPHDAHAADDTHAGHDTHAAGHDAHADHGEASALMVVPLCVTAALGLVLGLTDLGGYAELAARVGTAVTGGGP